MKLKPLFPVTSRPTPSPDRGFQFTRGLEIRMPRAAFAACSLFVGGALAQAQVTPQETTALEANGPAKNAGIYHMATGTWTRGAKRSGMTDVIYSNTALTGYHLNASMFGNANIIYDNGAIPGANNPDQPSADRDEYSITTVDIGYCDFGAAGTGGWELGFYDSYSNCGDIPSPTALLQTGPLPANGCWFVQLDLSGTPVCLAADGGGAVATTFGWSMQYSGSDRTPGVNRGFYMAGDPVNTDPNFILGGLPEDGTNTYYGLPSRCTTGGVDGGAAGSGYLTEDLWWVETDPNSMSPTGCYFFGGYDNFNGCGGNQFNSYASFYLELGAEFSACDGGNPVSSVYCTALPNSTGVGSKLSAFGSTSVSANDLELVAAITPQSFGFFITSQTNSAPTPVSFGLLCIDGNIGRLNLANQIKQADATGAGVTLDTRLGEWTVVGIPTAIGPYTATAGTTTYFQCWHWDPAAASTFNFSDGISITWTP